VLILVLILVLLWVLLTILLAAWTLWFQGYIYSQPVTGIQWRAPAAGAALTLFLCIWVWFDYGAPGRYRTLTEFSYREETEHKEVRVPGKKGEEVYKAFHTEQRGRIEFRGPNNQRMPDRPGEIIITENGEKRVFKPVPGETGGTRHYRDANGSTITEGDWGRVSTYHTGWLLMNLLLNFLFFVVWFLCLWLLLEFQSGHALGLAIVFWGVAILFILPPILTRAETVAQERAAAKKTSSIQSIPPVKTTKAAFPREATHAKLTKAARAELAEAVHSEGT
jgi:hypothetical protein